VSLIAEVLGANLVFAVVALGSGDVVLGWSERWSRAQIRPPSLERAGTAVLVGFGTLAYAGLLLAALGLFRLEAFAVCGAALVALTRHRLTGYARWAAAGVSTRRRPGVLVTVCAAAALVVAGAQWLAALAPAEATDELAYHLPEARTLADGHVIRLTLGHDHIYGNLPALVETLYGEALAVRGTALAHALHLSLVFAFLLMAAGIVRRLWGGQAAALAVLGILLYGDLTYNATTAYVDAAASAFEVGAVLLGVAWLTERRDGDVVAAALLIGLALAVKYTAATSAVALVVLVGIALARERRYALLARLGALGLAGCAYWYGKNLFRFGNPVFPFAFGHPGVSDATYQYFVQTVHAYGQRTVGDFARVPLRFASDENATAYLGFALAPLALAARGPRRAAALLLAYVVGYTACWYWLESSQVRFLMSASLAAIVLAAAALGAARGMIGSAVAVAAGVVIIAAAQIDAHGLKFNLREASRSWLATDKAGYALGLESTHDYLKRYFGCQVDAVDALAAARLSGDVALWDLSPSPEYPRYNDLEPIKITATTTSEAAAQLRARGIRFALAQGMPVEQLSSNVVARPLLRRAVQFWRRGDCTLYRLPA
jgi:hypothetical protein